MGNLKALKAVTALGFFSSDIEDRIDEFSSLCIMTFSPVVSCSSLSKYKIIWSKKLSKGPSSNRIHSSWFQIHEHSSGDISASSSLVKVNVNSFQLEIRLTMIWSCWINTMFIWNDFPKLGTNLVAALTSLDMYNLSHCSQSVINDYCLINYRIYKFNLIKSNS